MKIEKREQDFVNHILEKIKNIVPRNILISENIEAKKLNLYSKNLNSAFCCSPDYSMCSGKIKKAHSIQKKRSISNISEEGYVFTFHKTSGNAPLKIGVNQISTESMFCEFHDTEIFKKIDNEKLIPSKQQSCLFAIRTLAAELHKKAILYKSELSYDNGISLYDVAFHYLSFFNIFKKKKYNEISRCIIKIKEIPEIMCSTCYIPEIGFNLSCIQDTGKFIENYSNMFSFEILSDGIDNFICFEWLKKDNYCKDFIETLLIQDDIPNMIVKFVFAFCENSAFKQSWWNNLSQLKKNSLINYKNTNIDFCDYISIFTRFKNDKKKYVYWSLERILRDF